VKCRHCGTPLEITLIDLGSAPPSNAYLTAEALKEPETWLPLRVLVCGGCWLVQTEDFARPEELFRPEYPYLSGVSSSWLAHCEQYVEEVVERFGLGIASRVVEVAANDGTLLQYFQARGIPNVGIEPTARAAAVARDRGLAVVEEFFDERLARELVANGGSAHLVIANNVLAHVPDINGFTAAFAALLAADGVATFEFPHLVELVGSTQFDTIYHEHYSYLSLTAVKHIFENAGLAVFDLQRLDTHGGSLRVFAQREDTGRRPRAGRVGEALRREQEAGITTPEYYAGFQTRAERVKDDFLGFLLRAKAEGRTVAAYGAAAKGNTLLNYAGVRGDLIPLVVDRNPLKQGTFLPGSRIPVVPEDRLRVVRPAYVVILPWNLKGEIARQLEYVREWDGRFVTAVPELEVT